ncbi:hypothetical protein J6590_060646 [Homalodisca vitripennis]|nr:hypothetical protein J6590_060646 [Homalodisca vitripennis]
MGNKSSTRARISEQSRTCHREKYTKQMKSTLNNDNPELNRVGQICLIIRTDRGIRLIARDASVTRNANPHSMRNKLSIRARISELNTICHEAYRICN